MRRARVSRARATRAPWCGPSTGAVFGTTNEKYLGVNLKRVGLSTNDVVEYQVTWTRAIPAT